MVVKLEIRKLQHLPAPGLKLYLRERVHEINCLFDAAYVKERDFLFKAAEVCFLSPYPSERSQVGGQIWACPSWVWAAGCLQTCSSHLAMHLIFRASALIANTSLEFGCCFFGGQLPSLPWFSLPCQLYFRLEHPAISSPPLLCHQCLLLLIDSAFSGQADSALLHKGPRFSRQLYPSILRASPVASGIAMGSRGTLPWEAHL